MKAPLSWLKEYVDISLEPKKLGDKLTEVGLGVEKIEKVGTDTILDLEITPNRPDCLSIIGIAREIAAIEGKKIKYPALKTTLAPKKGAELLPLTIYPNFRITPRLSGIIINNVTVKDSPKWLQEKLASIGQKPINNIVDITNFVMYELGNPIHSFDYHKISGHKMWVKQAKGGEKFESVDEITYHLPKDAIIYEDTEKIFDLVGIKGGKNSGTYNDTKAVFIVVEVDDPILIRRASQSLALRSDASAIFERAVNRGGTIDALKRTTDLILETAGGEIASKLYDLKEQKFEPWKLSVRIERLNKILGIEIPEKKVLEILESLNLSPRVILERNNVPTPESDSGPASLARMTGRIIECTIPTYRNDLKIEEDLIEEVARLYGYNNFPKTLPVGEIPIQEIPYFKDYRLDEHVRNYFKASGFSEVYTYSLISETDLVGEGLNPDHVLRVDNPVSREFEYLRPTLKINLKKALRENRGVSKNISLFELGKVYLGKSLDSTKEEYVLFGITNEIDFFEVKGILERLMNDFQVSTELFIDIEDEGVIFSFSYTDFEQKVRSKTNHHKTFKPLPKYPPVIEDISVVVKHGIKIEDIIAEIKKVSSIIENVELMDQYESSRTFHIVYQHPEKNLTNEYVSVIREKILKHLKDKFGAKLKN